MRKLKFLVGATAMTLALVLVAAPAHAGSLAVAMDLTKVKICNFNMGGIGNFIHTQANSGMNFNMWSDSDTGNAAASASVGSTLNSNSTAVTICDFESGPVAVNMGGGGGMPGLCWPFLCYGKVAIAADLTEVKVCNFNAGLIINGIRTAANSGHNWTIAGDSMTGNANASANVSTNLNSNSTSVTVMEGGAGPMAINLGGWRALAVALEADLVKVKNMNLGLVANCISTSANSGGNMTMFGSSGTGNATARSTVASTVNTNSTSVMIADGSSGPVAANIGGSLAMCDGEMVDGHCLLDGGPVATNHGTSGKAISAEVDAVDVSNTNIGEVTNKVNTTANTGDNVTIGCCKDPCPDPCDPDPCDPDPCDPEGPDSDTGNATATSTVTNTVNTNSTSVVISGGGI
jgi:hypothetical protein